jgi:hypothetical protein
MSAEPANWLILILVRRLAVRSRAGEVVNGQPGADPARSVSSDR